MQTIKKFVFIGLQRVLEDWDITTLRRVFLSAPRCLVAFMRRRTNALVCQKYWMALKEVSNDYGEVFGMEDHA